jgi:hypothetical protein
MGANRSLKVNPNTFPGVTLTYFNQQVKGVILFGISVGQTIALNVPQDMSSNNTRH